MQGAVLDFQKSLNDWDNEVGHGDCGTTISSAAMDWPKLDSMCLWKEL